MVRQTGIQARDARLDPYSTLAVRRTQNRSHVLWRQRARALHRARSDANLTASDHLSFERARIGRSGPFQFPACRKRSLTIRTIIVAPGQPVPAPVRMAEFAEKRAGRDVTSVWRCVRLPAGAHGTARQGGHAQTLRPRPSGPIGRGSGFRNRPVLVRIQGGAPGRSRWPTGRGSRSRACPSDGWTPSASAMTENILGSVAERFSSGLQIRGRRFESCPVCQYFKTPVII